MKNFKNYVLSALSKVPVVSQMVIEYDRIWLIKNFNN